VGNRGGGRRDDLQARAEFDPYAAEQLAERRRPALAPGKRTLTGQLRAAAPRSSIQRKAAGAESSADGQRAASDDSSASATGVAAPGPAEAERLLPEVPRLFNAAVGRDLPRWTRAVDGVSPDAARVALAQLVGHAGEMRVAIETASLHLEGDPTASPIRQRSASGASRQLDDARQMLTGLGNIALPRVSPRSFRGSWIGGDAPTLAEGAAVDISIGNAGYPTIEALEAAAAIQAILGTATAAASPQQQHAIAAITERLPAGEGQQAFLRAILAGLGKDASVLPRDTEYGADDAIIEGIGNATLGPAGGMAADTWYGQSGAKQLAGDIVLSIQVSERFAPAVFRRQWEQLEEHWPTIVATALGFIGAEVLAAVFLASGNPALEIAGAALEFALLAYFVYCTAEDICHAAQAIAAWLSACVAAHGDRSKIGDASRKFCVVMREMMQLILTAALGGAIKGLSSLTKRGLHGVAEVPDARVVRAGVGREAPEWRKPLGDEEPEVGAVHERHEVEAQTHERHDRASTKGTTRTGKRTPLADSIPPAGRQFDEWFDSLTLGELDRLLADRSRSGMVGARKVIEDGIRHPGKLHEWLMVAEARKFKQWGVSMRTIKEGRSLTKATIGKYFRHGGAGSGTFHADLTSMIRKSKSYGEFLVRLNAWADDALVPSHSVRWPGEGRLGRYSLPENLQVKGP